MSRHGEILLAWGDGNGPGENGEYLFRLDIGALRRLQEKTKAGPFALLSRLARGSWEVDDVRETIRLGLICGAKVVDEKGVISDIRVNRLISEFVDERPLLGSVATAARILEAALYGPADDPVPKSTAAEAGDQSLKTASSPSPHSTDGDLSSATHPERSTRSRSGNSAVARPDIAPPTE